MPASEMDFHKYASLIGKRKKLFFSIALLIMTIAVLVSYLLPKKYEAKSIITIERNAVGDLFQGIAGPLSWNNSLKNIDYALTSRALLMKAVNNVDFNIRAQSDAAIESLLDEIRKNIDINKHAKDPNMFVVSFRYSNPRVARDFVNTLVQLFIEENILSTREEFYGARKFLSEQITINKDRLDRAQAKVNEFKSNQAAVAGNDSERVLRDIALGQQRLAELDLRGRQLEEEKTYAKDATDPLKVKLKALTRQLDELRTQFTDSFPEVINLTSRIESLQQQIHSGSNGHEDVLANPELWKIDSELKAIKANKVIQERLIAENKKLLNSMPNAKSALEKLEAEKTNEQNMYNLLSLRQGQSNISKEMEMQDKGTIFRVVDPAVIPVSPVSPNRNKIIFMGIAAGLAVGFGLLLAIDYIDNSVKTVDVMKTFGLPVLAVIPLIKSEDEIKCEKKTDFRVYLLSGAYFSLILAVLIMEFLGITLVDGIMSRLPLPHAVVKLLERL